MATNLSFWPLRAIVTSKIGFLGERWFILTGRMFPNVENTIYWRFVKLFSGVQLEVSGLSSQVSGLRYTYTYIYICIYICIYILYKYITYLALKTMIVQNNIKPSHTIGLAVAALAAAAANPVVFICLILFCTIIVFRARYVTYLYIYIYIYIWQFLFCSDAQRVVMTHTAGGGGIGGANLVYR